MPISTVQSIGDICVLSLSAVQIAFIKDRLSWDEKGPTHTLVFTQPWDHSGIPSRPRCLSLTQHIELPLAELVKAKDTHSPHFLSGAGLQACDIYQKWKGP